MLTRLSPGGVNAQRPPAEPDASGTPAKPAPIGSKLAQLVSSPVPVEHEGEAKASPWSVCVAAGWQVLSPSRWVPVAAPEA